MIIKKQKTTVELEEDEVAALRKASEVLEEVCATFDQCDDCPLKECCPQGQNPSLWVDDWVYALT
jgi:hypothetical protein